MLKSIPIFRNNIYYILLLRIIAATPIAAKTITAPIIP